MDKRLEEIKDNALKEKTHFKPLDGNKSRWGYTYTLSDLDFEHLITQAEEKQRLEERLDILSGHHDKALEQNQRYKQITKDLSKLCDDYRNGFVGEITDSFLVDRIIETLKGEANG